MTTAIVPHKRVTRTRLIGFIAMGFCAVGYVGFALALGAGKMEYLPMTQAAIIAAVAAVVGEVGLWVGAGCLGLTLFKKRKALFDKVMGRKPAASDV